MTNKGKEEGEAEKKREKEGEQKRIIQTNLSA